MNKLEQDDPCDGEEAGDEEQDDDRDVDGSVSYSYNLG
jgi:hypothetical protein